MDTACYYRVSVKALVLDETGRFLLAKEDNGKWEFIGGGLDHGEDPKSCLKREISEETGLVTTFISDSPKYFITAPRRNYNSYLANIIYDVKLRDLNFTPSEECIELRYFSAAEAAKEDLFANVEEFLKHFNVNNQIS
jgi:8-oxo-dGTP pyrophosphatase MutT (NUDIX family)